jgi:hypothetical protein
MQGEFRIKNHLKVSIFHIAMWVGLSELLIKFEKLNINMKGLMKA